MRYSIFVLIVSFVFFAMLCKKSCAAETISKLDSDKTLIVNGKRFFAIGIYYIPKSEKPFQELAEAGFNLVKCGKREELDAAHENGLKAWMSFGDRLDLSRDEEKQKEEIRKIVNEFKDHPALMIWESMDEPAWTWKKPWKPRASAEGLAQGHKFVKDIDPEHLLWINHAPRNTWKTLAKFSQNLDVIACDVYPVISRDIDAENTYAIMLNGKQTDLANLTISCVGEYIDKLKKAAGSKQAVWLVAQGFAWDDKLFPTYQQMRFMAYNAIIHGVNGILYWGTQAMPQPSQHWTDLKKVVREIADIEAIITSPNISHNIKKDYKEMGYSIDAGVEVMLKQYQGSIYMITANTSVGPAEVTFSELPFTGESVQVLGENRSVNITSDSFKDKFEPYGIHVYKK
ncbi:hypothetical protein GF312_08460 [Candidatus Poribacteria bacterium]|nr:hypothetical protein [Candidatus Poribacteria bacterium]